MEKKIREYRFRPEIYNTVCKQGFIRRKLRPMRFFYSLNGGPRIVPTKSPYTK